MVVGSKRHVSSLLGANTLLSLLGMVGVDVLRMDMMCGCQAKMAVHSWLLCALVPAYECFPATATRHHATHAKKTSPSNLESIVTSSPKENIAEQSRINRQPALSAKVREQYRLKVKRNISSKSVSIAYSGDHATSLGTSLQRCSGALLVQ